VPEEPASVLFAVLLPLDCHKLKLILQTLPFSRSLTGKMKSGNYPLGMTKLVIGMASLASSFHNKLNVLSTSSVMHFR